MRVAVLEWICGGGLHAIEPQQAPSGLRDEGWAMLHFLVEQFSQAGHDVATALDYRLIDLVRRQRLPAKVLDFNAYKDANRAATELGGVESTLSAWLPTALASDVCIVIAPEIDGVLEYCIKWLSDHNVHLLNCSRQFLMASCDKWLMAERFIAQGISHPRTWLAAEFDGQYLSMAQRWCVKPRWGAGCEGLQLVSDERLIELLTHLDDLQSWLIQPWIEGDAYSCSTIVDCNGQRQWLPLVTQDLTLGSADASAVSVAANVSYQGGQIAPANLQQLKPISMLDAALESLRGQEQCELLGWVGVDLVCDRQQRWYAIEVNPRMTTSVIGLGRASGINLAQQLIHAFQGQPMADFSGPWAEIRFAAGC